MIVKLLEVDKQILDGIKWLPTDGTELSNMVAQNMNNSAWHDALSTEIQRVREKNEEEMMELANDPIVLTLFKDSLFEKFCEFMSDIYKNRLGKMSALKRQTVIMQLEELWGLWLKIDLENIVARVTTSSQQQTTSEFTEAM